MKAARGRAGFYGQGAMARGDPGIGSFFGGIVRGVAGAVGGLGIPVVSGVARGVAGVLAPRTPGTAIVRAGAQSPTLLPQAPSMPGTGIQIGFPQLPIIGGGGGGISIGQFTGTGTMGGQAVAVGQDGRVCTLKGTHVNKHTYVTRGGGTSRWPNQVMVHPAHTECVKNRHQNPLNPRALSRALHRIMSAKRAFKMIGRVSIRPAGGAPARRRSSGGQSGGHKPGCRCVACKR